ncbi:demethylmenaquinone methyltransferase [Arcanobacterium bovis]|uniref:Demethylmenaquinone methyltransferase n=2 Tax=Arcanobacterium bovis TaxID=2529275 RepID=A0A4V2KR42_9ACTO|nr:demethylmenaquinone methyltransferase [Arcanobacterium bovis]TBW21618.1 demethylmenaquinone methyltransferase [Arcanobacterium bovis]
MKRATLAKNPHDVSEMFDEVAKKYDVTNTVLTGGLIHVWRKTTTDALDIYAGMKILDLAAGTGTSAAHYAQQGADVVACDFSRGMIEEGRRRYPHLSFVEGDAMNLPFEANSFDATTISYGLRNVSDPQKALREMLRVTKPGGILLVCEFSRPCNPVFSSLYKFFLGTAMPVISGVFSSDAAAYDYLAESILTWPAQDELARYISDAGWDRIEYKNLTNGIVALHRARKPV